MKQNKLKSKNRKLQYLGCAFLVLGIALIIVIDSVAGIPILAIWISGVAAMIVGVLLIAQPTAADIISTLLSQ